MSVARPVSSSASMMTPFRRGVPDAVSKRDGMPVVKLCTGYLVDGAPTALLPPGADGAAACVPVYEEMPGWSESTVGVNQRGSERPDRDETTCPVAEVRLHLREQALLLGLVDGFHRLQDAELVVLLVGEMDHRLDVLREAAAAVPDAREQERGPDPAVGPHRAADLIHIATHVGNQDGQVNAHHHGHEEHDQLDHAVIQDAQEGTC